MKAKVIGDHIAVKRIIPKNDESTVGGLSICEGHLEVGKTAYYDKSRSYVIRLLDGEEYTMIKLNAVVAIE
jgi:co-chaperonin GroES (HSP10)